MTSPYFPLEVIQTHSRTDGYRAFVRDEEESYAFVLVEYVDRRLTCWCPDGEAHAESPDTEPPCAHLKAVVDQRTADNAAKGPKLGVLVPSTFVD